MHYFSNKILKTAERGFSAPSPP